MQLLATIIISYYLINYVQTAPKTSAETGNDIENFLMGGNAVKELSPKGGNTEESNKKPDKFMEDLIEVQRTYRSLKEKWHRMMVEKNQVIQAASSTLPPAIPIPTSTTSSEIQEIDINVFEAPDKFQDISSDKSEFDDEAFVDISVTGPTTVAVHQPTANHVASELDQIQNAIREAFGGGTGQGKENKISLSEIITPKVAVQMDGVVTTVRMDQTTPIPVETSTPDSDEGRIIPQNFNGPVMLNARTTAAPRPEILRQEDNQPQMAIATQEAAGSVDQTGISSQKGFPDQNVSIPQQAPAPPVPAPLVPAPVQLPPIRPPMVPNEFTPINGPTLTQDQVVPNLQQVEPGPIEDPQAIVTPNLSNTQHDLPSPLGAVSSPVVQQGLPILQEEKPLISANRPAPFPKVATPWRHKMESMDHAEDPFEPVTLPSTQQVPSTTSELPTTSTTTALPMHILPTSSFHSSGVHPDSLPATNLFRYPDQVKIPFFGAKSEDSEGSLETAPPVRPTTPEPFRSDEIQNLEDVEHIKEHKKPGDLRTQESELLNIEDPDVPDENEEIEVDSETESDPESISEDSEDDGEEITASEEVITTTPRGIENNEDYVEDTFSQEMPLGSESQAKVPESFGIGKAPSFEESVMEPEPNKAESEPSGVFGSPPGSQKPRPKAFGSVPSSSGPVDSGFGNFGSPPGFGSPGPSELGTFGSKRGPSAPDFEAIIPEEPSRPSGTKKSDSMNALEGLNDLLDGVSLRSGPNGPSGQLGSPPGSVGSGSAPQPPVTAPPMAPSGFGSFGIGRSPPGFSEPVGPTLPPSIRPQKPSFPTLVEQVENFFNEEDSVDTGASSALGSFGSDEVVANVPVSQNIQILDDPKPRPTRPPMHMATSRNPIGIFGTKLQTINQKAYKPPMFSSALDSKTVKMVHLGNPYLTRTTVQPIGPHGLAEPVMSVDTELPAWNGVEKDRGIINKARREYQKEFEQQIRDVRIIDEEINRISKMNDDGRSKTAQRCSQVYAHTLSLPQIQKMSHSLGLGDVAVVIQKAADLTENQENDIAQLELDLEEKRKLIAKVEILLSLAESRALLFDLLNEQKKIAEKMENHALDLLQKTNFRPQTPSPFSAASDISELSSAVQQVLNSKSAASKTGWSMMKRKLHKKSKTPKKFEVIEPSDVVIKNSFMEFNKKAGHLQETAEIVEPVLTVSQNDKFGRQPVAKSLHIRPIPLAPPTMSPKILTLIPRPFQMAAHHHTVSKPLAPPGANEADTVHELIDMLHEDIVKLPAEEEERICRQVQCDFEKADLCNYESSHDETTRRLLLKSKSLRQKRSSALMPGITDDLLAEPSNIADDLLPYTFRAWSIWAGRRADRTKQIDIGPNFSSRNHHFAAVFLEPQQAGILSIPLVLSPTSTKIRLRLFEGTRGIRLRICCDRYCPMETEQGLYRGHRSWLRKTVTCPANTQTLSFECLNDGPDRGACGVDEVFVDSNRCHQYFNGSDQN